MNDAPKARWYKDLIQRANNFAEEIGLDDFTTNKFRDFLLDIAKEQYRRGNKSGAAWAFSQAEKKLAA